MTPSNTPARKGTPAPILERLHKEATAALKSPEVIEKLKGLGADVRPGTPEAMKTLVPESSLK